MTLQEELATFAADDAFDRLMNYKEGDDTALKLVQTLKRAFPTCTVSHELGSKQATVKDPVTGEKVTVRLAMGGILKATAR